MTASMDAPYLITMAIHPDHNAAGRFRTACTKLAVSDLVAGYEELVSTAPHRHDSGRMYFVGHDGRPSTGSRSNRIEEHLAIALANDHARWEIPARASVDLLDYQVPLKAHRSDAGVGKIDIFGLSADGIPIVVELKVLGKSQPDTPLRALLEAFAYAAIIEANASAITGEIGTISGRDITSERPDILVVAPADYWDYWFHKSTAQGWIDSLGSLANDLAQALHIDISLLSIGAPELELGLEGARPRILSGFRTEGVARWSGRS